ncbi:MAG: NADH-quinone oxidoreductase subunit J [Breznakibacter sp.]
MSLHEILFIVIATVVLVFSFMTVVSRRILRSATYLLFVLLGTAGIYAWLQYAFMASVQVALYAGGIVVIIVFSILLTHHIHHKTQPFPPLRIFLGFGLAALGAGITVASILNHDFKVHEADPLLIDMKTIGQQLVNTGNNGFVLPFEVISILLLAVLIGAIVVAKKEKTNADQPKN